MIMKTIFRISLLSIATFIAFGAVSANVFQPKFLSIHIVMSSKSYWDGPTKSCIPREKGGCCHIWTDGMTTGAGEISGELSTERSRMLQLTVSRGKGMNNDTYLKYFSDGRFTLDGPVSFDPNILSGLGLDPGYTIPAGAYPFTANGDKLTITFK
jgi:hypothetical protein